MLTPLDTLPVGFPDDPKRDGGPIRTLGWGVLEWATNIPFIQPNGPKAGQVFEPTLRQVRFLLWWYALDDSGEFIYRHGVRRLAKGSGKSPFAAFLALCELCGPVRFDHWDPDVMGGAVGRSVAMPLVQIAATAEHQTKNTMRMVREFGAKGSPLSNMYGLDPGKTIFYHPMAGGELAAITSQSTSAEGAEPTAVICDETEWWLPSQGGDDLFETLDRNLAKSNSRMIETCNAWIPGIGSIAEATWDAFIAQEEGNLRGKTKILYDCIEAPADVELSDATSLLAALEAIYADCPWVNVQGIAERIWAPQTKPDVARRFYLNQRVSSERAWTTPTAWAKLADPEHVVEDDADICMFFDGSKSGDATALIGCEMDSGFIFEIGVWEPHDGAEVDASDVDRVVRVAFERWNVVAFFADVREWESYVKTSWPDEFGADLLVWASPGTQPPHPIAFDMRQRTIQFAQATELCQQEINEMAFTHDGSSAVARHIGNAQQRPYKQWTTVAKETPKSPRKIDAAVCVIGARMVRRLVLSSDSWSGGKQTAKSGQMWSF